MSHILIVDDEVSIQRSLEAVLQDEGYQVTMASNAEDALEELSKFRPDIIMLDIWMPGHDGIWALEEILKRFPNMIIVMMSGHGTIETAVKATKLGAFDFIEKPLSIEKVLVSIQNGLRFSSLKKQNTALKRQVRKTVPLIGKAPIIENIREKITRVAPTTGSVLITGENGTGKELVAQQIHAHSSRANTAFIEVNCAAIPEELIESELFGYEKGAFTGALHQKRGRFDLANGGTLFLDEIGDMSLKTQAKILRILQEQTFERVGGTQTIRVDVRIIAATNKDLKSEIAKGNFREDLFYRLNVVPFWIPPLRDRNSDLPLLVQYFMDLMSDTHQKPKRSLSKEALSVLMAYSWPGNVRELKNLIERLLILTPSERENCEVQAAEILDFMQEEVNTHSPSLPTYSIETLEVGSLKEARNQFERDYISKALQSTHGNISKAADCLGIERTHLHRKIKALGIEWTDDSIE